MNHNAENHRGTRAARSGGKEAGYSLLLVLFLATVMVLAATAAAPNLYTQGKRQREEELIWRGNQYARAIGLYYRKFGHYPTKLEDLYKTTSGIRFLREPYKDPMNPAGDWRLIYVNSGGVLTGSVNYHTLAEMAAAERPGGTGGTGLAGMPGAPGAPNAPGMPGTPPETGRSGGTGGIDQGMQPPDQSNPSGTSRPGGSPSGTDTGTGGTISSTGTTGQESGGAIIGGSIVGVGSAVNEPSLKVYKKGHKYRQWEFIYNPLLVITMGTPPVTNPNQPANQPGGAAPVTNPNQGTGPGLGPAPPAPQQPPSDQPPQ